MNLDDVQGKPSERGIPIDQVGVSDLRYPIVLLDRKNARQRTVARISASVGLPHHFKGTHMSRFIEVLNAHRGEVTTHTVPAILEDLKTRLEAESSRVELRFPYFLERAAPVSGATALMDYDCGFVGESNGGGVDFVLTVRVPAGSVCPCSKAISDYGAHNQRGWIAIESRFRRRADGKLDFVWIEEMIAVAEEAASCPVYPLLKRPDERFVTMQGFDNALFVEDIVRNVAQSLQDDPRVIWFRVEVENHESIHNHNAFARIEWSRPPETKE